MQLVSISRAVREGQGIRPAPGGGRRAFEEAIKLFEMGKGCPVHPRNAACDAQLSPGFGWDLGGAGLETDGAVAGMSQNTNHSVRGVFPSSSSSPWCSVLAISLVLGHGVDIR